MLAPFSVKLEGVFIERVPRCTRLSGSRFLAALRFEVFGNSEQLSCRGILGSWMVVSILEIASK